MTQTHILRLWSVPRYATWFLSDTAKELGGALIRFSVPLIALIVTHDPAQAGIIAAVGLGLNVALTLIGGVLADRHRRTALMLLGALIGMALAAAFAILDATGAWTFWVLLAVNVLFNVRAGLFDIAGETALKDIVPAEAMGRAQAANQGRGAALQLGAGPLGGFLLGIGGWLVGLAALACHALAALAAWVLGRGTEREGPRDAAGSVSAASLSEPDEPLVVDTRAARASVLAEIRSGFAWTFARLDLRGVLFASTIITVGFNAAITTVVYSMQQAGHTPVTIGVLSAVAGASMLVGAIVAPLLVPRVPGGVLAICGLFLAATGILALSLTEQLLGVFLIFAASVFILPAVNSALLGYFMVAVPSELLGRAGSAMQVFGSAAVPLAPIIAGFGLAYIGRTSTLIVCGGLCVLAALIALGNGALRALPVERRWAEHAVRFTATTGR